MRVGLHWPNPDRQYPDGTPFVELCYLHGRAADDPHHPGPAMRRVERLAGRHPASSILLRVDWRQGQSYPETGDEVEAYVASLRELHQLRHLGDRLILQPGNEPQLESASGWRIVDRATLAFVAQCRKTLPEARLASVPVATFHPNRLGAPAGISPEGSPWADLDYVQLDAWRRVAGPPDVLSVHVYGNPRLTVTDDLQTRHELGWRFGLNVAETWAETHRALGLDHLPVWITEYNTAARGTDPPNRPAHNYRTGWLQESMRAVATALPQAAACCWFIGQKRGGHWGDFAPEANADLARDLDATVGTRIAVLDEGPAPAPVVGQTPQETLASPRALVPPLDGTIRVTDVFDTDRGRYRHGGLDIALAYRSVYRQPVKAPAAGTITAVWTTDHPSTRDPSQRDGWPYGNAVAMQDTSGVLWRFLHFDETPAPAIGDRVEPGQTLGRCDSTGNSTGHHVHMDASPGGVVDPETFRVKGPRIDPLRLYADAYAREVGYDPAVFRRQVTVESGWNPQAISTAGAEGIAQIIPRWHPAMRGKTFDPFASLEYAARLMAAHLDHRGGNYREALADYNTGRNSGGGFRAQGYRYADHVLEGVDMASTQELEALRKDRDANHTRKMAALGQLGTVIQAARRAGEDAFRPEDWQRVMTAERFYHDPEAA